MQYKGALSNFRKVEFAKMSLRENFETSKFAKINPGEKRFFEFTKINPRESLSSLSKQYIMMITS